MKKITVLIPGIGGPGGPGIVKSLRLVKERKIKIVGTDMDENAAAFGLVDKHYVVPPATDKNFIPTILKISKKEKVNVILPLSAAEISKLAWAKKKFLGEGIKISISDPKVLEIANNKNLLFNHCKKIGVPTPVFYLATNWPGFKKAVSALGYPKREVCFKPAAAKGGRGFRILTEKFDGLERLLSTRSSDVYLTSKGAEAIFKKAKPFPELVVMEYLPGKEYTVDALADEGKPIAIVPRSRDRVKLGVSVVGRVLKDKKIASYCQKIIESLGLHGNLGFQFKKDKNGIPKILESNPRLQGTTILSTAAGANLVYLAVKLALGEKIKKPKIKWGTKMIRYWEEIYYDKSGSLFTI